MKRSMKYEEVIITCAIVNKAIWYFVCMSSKYWVAKGSKKSKKCHLSQFGIEEKIKACKIRKVLKVCSAGYTK